MKKLSLTIFLTPIILISFAQYYSVNDADSFVNVREHANVNAGIVCKLPNETIVFESYSYEEQDKSNWVHVDFYLKKGTIRSNPEDYTPGIMKGYTLHSGFIYKTKLTAIEKLKPLKYKQIKNGYTCFNDSIKTTVTIAPFIQSKHAIQYSKINEGLYDKVDNRPMIGSDGSKPRDEIKSISVFIKNKPIAVPATAYKNLFNPSYQNDTYVDNNGGIYLVMYNSDAAGSYSCIFVFKNGVFVQRLVFTGEC